MPLRIILRTGNDISPFRRALIALLHPSVGDSAVICSGYIEESQYYSVLDDELLAALAAGCPKGVMTVAGKLNTDKWRQYYENFIGRLKQGKIAVTDKTAPLENWHAKVFLRLSSGEPVAGIVGSSNLTGPAYGELRPPSPYTPGWNYEADVVIWKPDSQITGIIRRGASVRQQFGIIDTILDPEVPQPSESDQLRSIYDRISSAIQ